jgi:threonine aldolase
VTGGRAFASDNASGVHPHVLEEIARVNQGHTPAYGDDPWTARATDALRAAFDADAEIFFCFGGTGANIVSLATVTRPHQSVLCADSAHLWNSECAAPERFFGGKLIPLPHHFGKLDCASVATQLGPTRGVHQTQPRVVTLTQPTEFGALYSCEEIRMLADFAHQNELLLHVDGARFANAAAALEVSLADLGPRSGVDILSFGGTKNGLLGAEAVIFFERGLAEQAGYTRKQAMQLASKMRFIAAQFIAYMDNELWRELATRANGMAARLASQCATIEGLEFICPVDCNMLFPRMPAAAIRSLQESFYFYTWDERESIARWVTSFDTTADDVDEFSAAVASAVSTALKSI